MKRKPLIITAIIALAVISIVAVTLFMKDSKIEPAKKEKKQGGEPEAEPEPEPLNTNSDE